MTHGMKLLIFGATGGTGRQLVEQGIAQGHRVTAFARNPGAMPAHDKNLFIVKGDLSDYGTLRKAVDGQDAVISVLGNKTSAAIWRSSTAISEGLAKIIRAMQERAVPRIVFVTSFGVNARIFRPEKLFIKFFLRNIFADIPRQETLLRNSALQWTIVRPARLVDGPRTGRYQAGEDLPIGLFSKISRADVADFLLKVVHAKEASGKIITISS